ncbi:GtrA family protein [archaeon]|jgi:putative flippase GtrA|nr:GtrA family protein [archaeon]MBT4373633.1 GtrA family protein [archaeon]MBT4531687.1 GtrA family protein [archaeon]MBT7001799.1 GtrA family protein [archaeon]MBT7281784.1 GtrA family protein [archaeon]
MKSNKKKFTLFCIVGILSMFVDLLIFNFLFNFKINFILCRGLAVFGATIFNFFINRSLTFSAKQHKIINQLPKHITIYSIVMLINILVSATLLELLGNQVLYANIASLSGIIYGIPISFIGSLLWTFRKKD